MKYLLPLLICLLLAAAVPARAEQGMDDTGYGQQDEQAAVEDEAAVPEETQDAAAGQDQTDMEQLRSRAADYKAQLAEEMPSTEEMKSLAEKYDIKTPSAEEVRNFGARHQGKFNKALDYAKQFQEFRREQADEYDSGALAPVEE
jgi:hypothetical protein